MSIFVATPVPYTIPSLVLWLDARDRNTLTFSTGVQVSAWRDKSPRHQNAAQGTGSAQPLWNQNLVVNKPGLAYDGSNDEMTISDNVLLEPGTGEYTMFIVLRYSTTGLVSKCGKGNNTSGDVGYSWTSTSCRGRTDSSNNFSSGGGFNSSSSYTLPAYVATFAFDGSTAYFYNNNVAAGDGSTAYSGAITGGAAGYRIGRAAAGSFVNEQTYEFCFYNRLLSSDEMLKMCRYLGNKWGCDVS